MNNMDEIYTKIWSTANSIRGHVDATEYRDYILGLMFYRFLSEQQDKYLLTAGSDKNLHQIANALGYAIPGEYSWQTLVRKVENETITLADFQGMIDSFNASLTWNQQTGQHFIGVLDDMRLNSSRLGTSDKDRAQSLADVVTLVDQITYTSDDGHDIVGDIYMYLIAQFAGNGGKKAGEFYTPAPVSELLAKIATNDLTDTEKQKGVSVYDFACGAGALLLSVQHQLPASTPVTFIGQELNTTTFDLARMNLMMHGADFDHMKVNNADTLAQDWPMRADDPTQPEECDIVAANPPYSAKWDSDGKLADPRFHDYGVLAPRSKADMAFILHGLHHLKESGTMAVVLPHGPLFRGAAEGKIRKQLVENNLIHAVIGLPANLFYSTSIPTLILVLKKNKTDHNVLFIDASKDFEKDKKQNILREQDIEKILTTYRKREDVEHYAHLASYKEIARNDFNLNIPRYVDTFEPEPPIDLLKVMNDLRDVDRQLHEQQKHLLFMANQLHADDPHVAEGLAAFVDYLKSVSGGAHERQ